MEKNSFVSFVSLLLFLWHCNNNQSPNVVNTRSVFKSSLTPSSSVQLDTITLVETPTLAALQPQTPVLTLPAGVAPASTVTTTTSTDTDTQTEIISVFTAGKLGQLTILNNSFTSFTLSWAPASKTKVAAATLQYRVYATTNAAISLASGPLADSLAVSQWQTNVTSFSFENLAENTTYILNVVVQDPNDPTSPLFYTPISIQTMQAGAPSPGAAGTLSLVVGATPAISQIVSWQPATAEDTSAVALTYQVYFCIGGGIPPSTACTLSTLADSTSNGTAVFPTPKTFAANASLQATLTGLLPATGYVVNVVVTDPSTKKQAIYEALSFTTSTTLSLPTGP